AVGVAVAHEARLHVGVVVDLERPERRRYDRGARCRSAAGAVVVVEAGGDDRVGDRLASGATHLTLDRLDPRRPAPGLLDRRATVEAGDRAGHWTQLTQASIAACRCPSGSMRARPARPNATSARP